MATLKLVYRVDPNTDEVRSRDCNAVGNAYRKKLLKGTGSDKLIWFETEEAARDDYLPNYFSANSIASRARRHIADLTKMGVLLCASDGFFDSNNTAEIFIEIKQCDYTFRYNIKRDN